MALLSKSRPADPVASVPGVVAATAIQRLEPIAHGDWNALLRTHPDASFFHSAEWARVLQATYGHRPIYFTAVKDHQLSGLLPVVEVVSPLTGRRGVSLAFTDFCLPLTSVATSAGELLQEVLRFGQTSGWNYYEARGGLNEPPSLSFCGHSVALSVGEQELYRQLAREVRTAIRKAEGSGVQVEISSTEAAVRTFYRLHCRTRRRHGLPPQAWAFFRNIFQHVLAKGMGFVAVATHQQRPIAASVFFYFGKQAIYKYGASDRRFQHLRGNNLVMWEAMKWCARLGCATLDFGRSNLAEQGLRRFKSGFGAAERIIDYCKFDFRSQSFVKAQDRGQGWHNHVFRLLPIPVARLLGALLYPHLS